MNGTNQLAKQQHPMLCPKCSSLWGTTDGSTPQPHDIDGMDDMPDEHEYFWLHCCRCDHEWKWKGRA